MHSPAAIKSVPSFTARKMLGENVALAIRSGTGAVVEVTLCRDDEWCVSGAADQVAAASPVLLAAGMTLRSTEHDAELGETFAYWMSK